jgi:hypothetical protein
MKDIVDLKICGLTIDEVKEILLKIREIEQRDPSRLLSAMIYGLENKPLKEADEIVRNIFPRSNFCYFFTATIKLDKKVKE